MKNMFTVSSASSLSFMACTCNSFAFFFWFSNWSNFSLVISSSSNVSWHGIIKQSIGKVKGLPSTWQLKAQAEFSCVWRGRQCAPPPWPSPPRPWCPARPWGCCSSCSCRWWARWRIWWRSSCGPGPPLSPPTPPAARPTSQPDNGQQTVDLKSNIFFSKNILWFIIPTSSWLPAPRCCSLSFCSLALVMA